MGDRDGDEDIACADYLATLLNGTNPDPLRYEQRVRNSISGDASLPKTIPTCRPRILNFAPLPIDSTSPYQVHGCMTTWSCAGFYPAARTDNEYATGPPPVPADSGVKPAPSPAPSTDQVIEGTERSRCPGPHGDDDLLVGHRRRVAGREHAGQRRLAARIDLDLARGLTRLPCP